MGFNPYCKEDLVYMENKDMIHKNLREDSGRIYQGPTISKHWMFGQFENGILETVLDMLNRAHKFSPAAKASPIAVSRALSATVNSSDDNGLLLGCWGGNDYKKKKKKKKKKSTCVDTTA